MCVLCVIISIIYLFSLQQKEHTSNSIKSRNIFNLYNNLGKQGIYTNEIKPYFNVSNNHPLRNPVVNMLPKILPATLNPKATTNKIDSTKKTSTLNDDDKQTFDNNNVQTTGAQIGLNKVHKHFFNSLKINTADAKAMQTDKLPDKNSAKLNTVLTRSSKVSKDSSQMSSGLPQIRKTTPRLAKTRSAQNMKLMAQALSSKSSSNCSTLKAKEKDNVDKTIDEQCAESNIVNSILSLLKKKYI